MFVHGTDDQLVPIKSSQKLYDNLKSKKKVFITVNDYYHDVFKGNKCENICFYIKRFLVSQKFSIQNEKIEL